MIYLEGDVLPFWRVHGADDRDGILEVAAPGEELTIERDILGQFYDGCETRAQEKREEELTVGKPLGWCKVVAEATLEGPAGPVRATAGTSVCISPKGQSRRVPNTVELLRDPPGCRC